MTGRRRISIKRAAWSTLTLLALAVAAAPAAAAAPPANDALAAAQVLASPRGMVQGFNFDATKEPGEADHAGVPGGGSVWYRWTAPADGQLSVGVWPDSDFDPLLAVYTGTDVAALALVAASDDVDEYDKGSLVSFRVVAGTAYSIVVDGAGGGRGKFELRWAPAPVNDNFAEAAILAGMSGRTAGRSTGATVEPNEPGYGDSVWFRWTAPADGLVKFDTLGSGYDTVLTAYRGDSLGALRSLASNDDGPHLPCCASWVSFRAEAGQAYALKLTPYDEAGAFVLRWSPVVRGTAGRDVLSGTAGSEEIHGGGGNDVIRGGGGDDVIVGGGGSDFLTGGAGTDVLSGGAGNDTLSDLLGVDALLGGAGDDVLMARDGGRHDLVVGGDGRDTCRADRRDRKFSCP